MDENLEQRACIKFCVANGFKCSETLKMLEKAFGESCLGKTQAYEWYKRFKGGRTSLDHDEIPGRPTTSVTEENIESAKQIVLQNRSVPIREIAVLLGISYGSAEHILTDVLGLKRVASRLVPKKLNFIQKQRRVDVAKEMISNADSDPYSPDMAPCDFFLFPRLKLPLRGTRFETIEAIKENSLRELKAIPSAAYKTCMENWIKRWHACIAAGGEYFEGDNKENY